MFHGGTITVQRRADMDDVDELIYGYVVFCLPIFETFAGMRFRMCDCFCMQVHILS